MQEVVGAPFGAPLVERAMAAAPAGLALMAFGASATPLLGSGRECLVIDPDPLALLATSVQLAGPPPDEVSQVLTRVLDAPYRGRPWGQTLRELYLTSCPACSRPIPAAAFRWQGTPAVPFSRIVRCEHCGFVGEAPAEAEDQSLAAEAGPGRTLSWETMERVVTAADPLRLRAEQATGFYTPRSLWAQWQTMRILRDLDPPQNQRRALQWVLAETLWRTSSLADQPEHLWQAMVRRPRRFVEPSVYAVLNDCLAYVQGQTGSVLAGPGERANIHLVQRWPADYLQRSPPSPIGLALIQAPPCLPLYWLLRYAWSGWLFGPEAAAMMADLLALRLGDWDLWQRRVGDAIKAVQARLAPGGGVFVQWRWRGDADPSVAVMTTLGPLAGASVAAVEGAGWVAQAAITATTIPAPEPPSEPGLLLDVLGQIGEPAVAARLRPLLLAHGLRCGESGGIDDGEDALQSLLDPETPPAGVQVVGSGGDAWEHGEMPWWWLEEPPASWAPASDQGERAARAVLAEGPLPSTDDLGWRMSLRLAPSCAPDWPWIEALAASYGKMREGRLALRSQDLPDQRHAELAEFARALVVAGRRMAFASSAWSEGDHLFVNWRQGDQARICFLLTYTTDLTPLLWQSRTPVPGLQRFLVLPGGRAGLVQWRIDHQPLWAALALAGGWTFTKFRHLRDMLMQTDLEPYRWLAHLGLDPITASHAEQMRLL